MKIKKIPKKDLGKVVAIHKSSFPGFFLTELGGHFLKLYYHCILNHQHGLLIGYYNGDSLMGFCAATKQSKGFNTNLVKDNLFKFAGLGLRLIFTKPSAFIRLVRNFTKRSGDIQDDSSYAELLSIGVSQISQSRGIGTKLMSYLEAELQTQLCTSLSLTTDYENNEKAIFFYRKLGYEVYYDFIAYPRRKMYRLIKNFN